MLRDALAAALHGQADIEGGELFDAHAFTDEGPGDCERWADAILSDPAFREALVEAVEEALWEPLAPVPQELRDIDARLARAIVDRMLGGAE